MCSVQPGRNEGGLPEPGGMLDGIVARQVFHLGDLGGEIGRVRCRRSSQTQLTSRRKHPRPPRSGHWGGRIGIAPLSWSWGIRSGKCRVGIIALCVRHHRRANCAAQAEAGGGIARVFSSRIQSRARRLVRHARKSIGAVRKEIGQDRSSRARSRRMFGWIGRTSRNSNEWRDAGISLTGTRPIPGILAVPGRDGCVVNGDGHQRHTTSVKGRRKIMTDHLLRSDLHPPISR